MAKVTKDTEKWGKFTAITDGITFVGEELVSLQIPYNDANPVNHHILCMNGNQIILGVDEKLKVPNSVRENWEISVMETNKAKKKMNHMQEIKA